MNHQRPKIWAVGGGKGGVGKSVVSVLLAMDLARNSQRTVLVDADLGGANLHTMLGIKTPIRTLNDFVIKKHLAIGDICIQSSERNLEVVCGASEILSFSNLHISQRYRVIQNLTKLPADHIVLDLGAGNSLTMLDFFLLADQPIIVLTPQPTSIQNAYGFLRNAVYRKLLRLAKRHSSLKKVIATAMDPKNEERLRTVGDLYEAVRMTHGAAMAVRLRNTVARMRPMLITNMIRNERERATGKIIQTVAEKYLSIYPQVIGAIPHDHQVDSYLSRMTPLTELTYDNPCMNSMAGIVHRLVDEISYQYAQQLAYR